MQSLSATAVVTKSDWPSSLEASVVVREENGDEYACNCVIRQPGGPGQSTEIGAISEHLPYLNARYGASHFSTTVVSAVLAAAGHLPRSDG